MVKHVRYNLGKVLMFKTVITQGAVKTPLTTLFSTFKGLGILLEGGRDYTARDTKRAADLLISPTSIAIKRIYNITLA